MIIHCRFGMTATRVTVVAAASDESPSERLRRRLGPRRRKAAGLGRRRSNKWSNAPAAGELCGGGLGVLHLAGVARMDKTFDSTEALLKNDGFEPCMCYCYLHILRPRPFRCAPRPRPGFLLFFAPRPVRPCAPAIPGGPRPSPVKQMVNAPAAGELCGGGLGALHLAGPTALPRRRSLLRGRQGRDQQSGLWQRLCGSEVTNGIGFEDADG
jgi:hypothetical protein